MLFLIPDQERSYVTKMKIPDQEFTPDEEFNVQYPFSEFLAPY